MSTKLVDLFNQFAGSTPSGVEENKPVTDYLKKTVDTFVTNLGKKIEGKIPVEHQNGSSNLNQYFDLGGGNNQNGTTLENRQGYGGSGIPRVDSNGSIWGYGEVIQSSPTPVVLDSPSVVDSSREVREKTDFEKWFESDGEILLQQYNAGRIDMKQYCDEVVAHISDEALHEVHVGVARMYNTFVPMCDRLDEKYAGTEDAHQLMLAERRQGVREYLDTFCASIDEAEKVRLDSVEMTDEEMEDAIGTEAFTQSILYGVGMTQQDYHDYRVGQQMSNLHDSIARTATQLQEANGLSPMETPDAP